MDLKTAHKIAADNPPEGDLCFVRGLGLFWLYGLFV